MKHWKFGAVITTAAVTLLISGCGGSNGYGGSSGSSGSGLVTTIAVTPASSTIAINGAQQFTATAKDSSGNTVSGVIFNWASSNSSVATVNNSGLATAMAAGTAKITASLNYGGSGCTGPYCSGSGTAYTITSNAATLTVSAADTVMGTAATGHPFIGALVTLKDAQGQTQFATTDAHGRFILATAGLHAPFLLKVADDRGHIMYSIATGQGVANLDPLSDAMTRLWYLSHGMTVDTDFANPGSQLAMHAVSLRTLDGALVRALANSLAAHGLNPSAISLFQTPFDANGNGLDGLLDQLEFSTSGNQITVTDIMGGSQIVLQASDHAISIARTDPSSQTPVVRTLRFAH